MNRMTTVTLVCALSVFMAVAAHAQDNRRVPHKGSQAVGFEVGAFIPSSDTGDQLESTPPVLGFYEYYLTPRVSVRGTTGFQQPSLLGSPIDRVRMVPFRADLNYNWEGGRWHPFVGAGLGAYYLQYRRRGQQLGETATNFGVNAGAGIEYFFNRQIAFKGEGRYHAVSDFGRVDPSGTTLTVGFKTYF